MTRFKDVLIVGAGSFGSSTVKRLYELGIRVTVVDKNKRRLEEIKDWAVDVLVVDVINKEALEEITRRNFDAAIIAVGSVFSTILLLTVYLRDLGIPFIVGRAANKLQGEILKRIGCNKVIMPEEIVGKDLAESLVLGEAKELELDEKHSIIEFLAVPGWWGKKVGELSFTDKGVVVCAVWRKPKEDNKERQLITSIDKDFTVKEGDSLILLGKNKVLYRLAKS